MKPTIRQILAGVLLACLVSLPVFAALTGDISGTVTDPNGAVVTGAKVTVKNVSTGTIRTAVTGDMGQFSVAQLELGTYEVSIEKSGFKAYTEKVTVRSGEAARMSPQLEVGGAGEVVTVEATNQTLDVATAQISNTHFKSPLSGAAARARACITGRQFPSP